jgi:diguanylate cyclase (GGDEF)-like protein
VIYPPEGKELDRALAMGRPTDHAVAVEPGPAVPTWDELNALTRVFAGLGEGHQPVIDRLCRLIAETMRTPFARIVVEDHETHVGDPDTAPAIVEPIKSGDRTLGQILIGPRDRAPYSASEVAKLTHYGQLAAHLLDASARQMEWHRLAMIDEVTQLPNRRYLIQALESLVRRASAERFPLTVVLFDLDGFKHFNDTYGHAAGDQILRETSQLIRRHCRQQDIVARYAGDEFVIVFWDPEGPRTVGSKHPTDCLGVLQRFKTALAAKQFGKLGPESKGRLTISGGLATYPWDAQSSLELIEQADQAMLQAKRAGKNRIYLVGGESEPSDNSPMS